MKMRHILSVTFGLLTSVSLLYGQTPQEVHRAFASLRSDNIRYNCSNATAWLFIRREKLKDQIEQELYHTDRQGRDALMHILLHTESYVPDDRFRKLLLLRIPEQDTFVKNDDIMGSVRVQWEAWQYIDRHYSDFKPLLNDAVSRTDSTFLLWGITWLFAKHQDLGSNLGLYSDEVMRRAAGNLANDNIKCNATFAVRLFLLLGKHSVPTLQRTAKSSDFQQSNFSRALLDAIQSGKHNAFGYLNAFCEINRTPTKEEPPAEPGWLREITQKYYFAEGGEMPSYP